MFLRALKRAGGLQNTSRRFYSSGHSEDSKQKGMEVSITKILGVAATAGGVYAYKNADRDKPLIKTPLYKEQDARQHKRNENYQKRYKTSFIKSYIKDRGGIGQRQYNRATASAIPTTLISSGSPYENQFGGSIHTDKLGPRKERIRVYAPIKTE